VRARLQSVRALSGQRKRVYDEEGDYDYEEEEEEQHAGHGHGHGGHAADHRQIHDEMAELRTEREEMQRAMDQQREMRLQLLAERCTTSILISLNINYIICREVYHLHDYCHT
jgi:hypothetical protein